jgi:DNA invertase Pin-like site-specific DNA recombinase/ssDNA-binding Zn-finger/Zn-ribbon topoisomerase 1
MYLRKSRQDDPNETVEEVLAKHEAQLQEYARRELGGEIPQERIYREIVSGESIDERVEIKKVLASIEAPDVTGVLVVDPQRLSRGDLRDCATLMDAFQYTHTLIITPMMVYDLAKKMERRFFQDELLRGRDYLEYIKDTLRRGREAAVRRGCYISPTPPYGYNRIKLGRDWTLKPNEDADAVRLMFKWYVEDDLSLGALARRLDEYGYRSPKGEHWSRWSIRPMLKNIHYIGKVSYNRRQTVTVVEEGERVHRVQLRPEEDVIIAEGIHDGIIDPVLFEAAGQRLKNNPRNWSEDELRNVLAGLLVCSKCGKTLILRSSKIARDRVMCPNKPQCLKSAIYEDVVNAVIVALEQTELPKLQEKLANGEGDAAVIQKRRLAKLSKQMEEYREQEDTQYDLLERKKYTQAVFDRRNAALREKMEACEREIKLARAALPKNVDYTERIITLEKAIAALRDPDVPNKAANRLLRSIVERIEYSAPPVGSAETDTRLDVYLRL